MRDRGAVDVASSAQTVQYNRSRRYRRENGIYYSPGDVAEALVKWSVQTAKDTIFDPSFGGCVFLRAGWERLNQLGATDAPRRLFGTDRDLNALRDAARLVELGADPEQFRHADFFTVRPEDLGGPFQAVVGNPPYVRAHVLSDDDRRAARESLPDGIQLSAAASYWAYFVLHALAFVAPGGRMALILPGTFLRADYAEVIRSELHKAFGSVHVLVIDEHLFADVEEQSVVVLAEQRGKGPGTVRIGATKREGLILEQPMKQGEHPLATSDVIAHWARGLHNSETLRLYDALASRIEQLGSVSDVRIGVVTGANKFFLVSNDTRHRLGIEDSALLPVVARTAQLRGLWCTIDDVAASSLQLFVPPTLDLPPGAARYVEYGEQLGVHRGTKCAQRTPWYVPRDTAPPDAFLSCMAWVRPRLVLNSAKAACTNTLLAVNFRSELDDEQRTAYTVGMLSTVSQLSAEMEGRTCGGGLLKIEPSDARRLVVPKVMLTDSERMHLDALCRGGEWEKARRLVDTHLEHDTLSEVELRVLEEALIRARSRRLSRS